MHCTRAVVPDCDGDDEDATTRSFPWHEHGFSLNNRLEPLSRPRSPCVHIGIAPNEPNDDGIGDVPNDVTCYLRAAVYTAGTKNQHRRTLGEEDGRDSLKIIIIITHHIWFSHLENFVKINTSRTTSRNRIRKRKTLRRMLCGFEKYFMHCFDDVPACLTKIRNEITFGVIAAQAA